MLSLHTNIAALNTKSNLTGTQTALSTSMTRLGTGFRINSAMDDAAGLQIATRLDAQSRGMQVAMKNAQNGISMLQTAEGALNEVSNILQRMKDLSTEGANATSTKADKSAMQSEFAELGKELTNIMKNTSFGGEKLLQGGKLTDEMKFQIGASADESMTVNMKDGMTALNNALGSVSKTFFKDDAAGTAYATAVKTATDAMPALVTATDTAKAAYDAAPTDGAKKTAYETALKAQQDGQAAVDKATNGDEIGKTDTINTIQAALDSVGSVRSSLGANANRLDHVNNNLANVNNNTLAAKGRIMDTDYANESASMTSKQMLMQAGTSMLKQSGSMSSLAMSLLQ
ncbi:Lateral flagellin [Chromobacterium haemolyticum]|uniref:Flagellin n=1 Tax=Chromobacterium fluminis TaxID=3044269 RepID=A0ABX0LB56_9NEIS|nr:flagellin [Chromobacterium haemolyticum]NHR06641.1 Lateral flagellin [Chromobacterium haemolyticum]